VKRYLHSLIPVVEMDDVMIASQSQHIRLPQRSDAVEGREDITTGQPLKVVPDSDPRTVSQDPAVPTKEPKK
jgi:hypothetical protein